MGTEIQEGKTFDENLMDRIRDSIGELMPEEKLKEILERGVDELLGVMMRNAVDQWLKDNPERIKEAIKNAIEDGAGVCMVKALGRHFEPVFAQLGDALQRNGIF